MTTYFLNSLLVLFYLHTGGRQNGTGPSLPEALQVKEDGAYSLAWAAFIMLSLIVVIAFSRKVCTWRRQHKLKMQMAGQNHPAIPAMVYETPRLADLDKTTEQPEFAPPQQEALPDSLPAGEEVQEPDDYHSYTQLDSLEED